MDWYIIQAYSNCEKKVKAALEERIDISGLSSKFGEIMTVSYTHLTLPTTPYV